MLKDLAIEGKVILVSTHNLGSVPDFCDNAVLINRTLLAYGKTKDVFTTENLQKAFGGVLRRFVLNADNLHADEDKREVTVITDDERPVVLYGERGREQLASSDLARSSTHQRFTTTTEEQ